MEPRKRLRGVFFFVWYWFCVQSVKRASSLSYRKIRMEVNGRERCNSIKHIRGQRRGPDTQQTPLSEISRDSVKLFINDLKTYLFI